MGIPGSANLLLAAAEAEPYQIEQSLRFSGDSNQYLYRTGATTAQGGVSLWVKFHRDVGAYTAGVYDPIVYLSGGGPWLYRSPYGYLYYRSISSGGDTTWGNQITRDHTAWYHIFLKFNSSNSTSLYVNNVLWGTKTSATIGTSSGDQRVGYDGTYLAQCYLAEYHAAFGESLDATDFGEYDESGVWRPIEFTGSHGSNGFYLKFDPSAANGLGHDHSGNGNHFTDAGGFTTSGDLTDVMSDTPTNNWCTGNNLAVSSGDGVWTSNGGGNGNLSAYLHNTRTAIATIPCPTTGKWYCEITPTTHSGTNYVGISDIDNSNWVVDNGQFWDSTYGGYAYTTSGNKINNATSTSYGDSWGKGDVIGIAFDAGGGTLTFYKNGATQGTAFTSISTSKNWVISARGGGSATFNVNFNFGQREFAHPPGTSSATSHFNTVLYTGDGNTTKAVTGVGFQPDLVWIKAVNQSWWHVWGDSVRGSSGTNGLNLNSNDTAYEGDENSGHVESWDTDGFTVMEADSGTSKVANVNQDGYQYVAWCFKAGGTASSNTDGTITSSVSAGSGFSIVTYSGAGSGTVGHGLGVTPNWVIVKKRNAAGDWAVQSDYYGPTKVLYLNTNDGQGNAGTVWNSTAPTSSVFSVGNHTLSGVSGNDYVAYCFADTEGLIKTGTYTGDSSANGPYIECGFKPAMVIIKYAGTTSSGDWFMYDTARTNGESLNPNRNIAESSSYPVHLQNTGFKIATSDSQINYTGYPYMFIAFAENFSADTDYKALNTKNLPASDIKDGSDYFNTVLYNGNTTTQSITGVGFQPSFSWIKYRDATSSHGLFDAVRGAGKSLRSDATTVEQTQTDSLTSFDSDGFSLGDNTETGPDVNYRTGGYVSWNWLAGGSGSNNTAGTITSTVSASPSSGFSIVTWTGNATNGSVGHGLGVAPKLLIVKDTDNAYNWYVFTTATGTNLRFEGLNSTSAATTQASQFTASSTTISNLTTSASLNTNGATMLMYCFAEVEGYCKISSYTGSGYNDGPFVFTGFRPALVLTKRSNSTSNWIILDSTRDVDNPAENWLRPNSSGLEESTGPDLDIDFLANGFKIRNNGTDGNINGSTYIYMALAENPFGGDGVSPATAR